jgi:hypothetical protein
MKLSLLDLEDCNPIQYVVVYSPHSETSAWWTRPLQPRFAHVEVWRRIEPGFYHVIQPFCDYVALGVVEAEPAGYFQNVTARRRMGRALSPIGLKTCVSLVKAVLAIRAPWVITPYQLYKYIAHRKGVV